MEQRRKELKFTINDSSKLQDALGGVIKYYRQEVERL